MSEVIPFPKLRRTQKKRRRAMSITWSNRRRSIVFRAPTAKDIEACGIPIVINWGGETPMIGFDGKAMTAMIARLSGLRRSAVLRLDSRDWCSCAYLLAVYFLPDNRRPYRPTVTKSIIRKKPPG